jgi:hypothetical protein
MGHTCRVEEEAAVKCCLPDGHTLTSPNDWVQATQSCACFRVWWYVQARCRLQALASPWAPDPGRWAVSAGSEFMRIQAAISSSS